MSTRPRGHESSGPAADLPDPPRGPAPGSRAWRAEREGNWPPKVDEVRVLRVQPTDRLLVKLGDDIDSDELPELALSIAESVAAWAGIDDLARILVVANGADVEVLRAGEDA